jgi:hypothetical protein
MIPIQVSNKSISYGGREFNNVRKYRIPGKTGTIMVVLPGVPDYFSKAISMYYYLVPRLTPPQ